MLYGCTPKSLSTAFFIFIIWNYQKINFIALRLENVICYTPRVHREHDTPHTCVICVQTPTQVVLKAQKRKLTFYVVFFLAFLGKQVEYGFHLCFLTTFGMASMLVLIWLPM